jgi:hypothetical protein
MTTATKTADIPPTAELQMAAERAARGKLDLAEAREAAAAVDRIRAQNGRLFGEQEVGVSIIREFRGQLPE